MNRAATWALLILLAINAMNFFDRQILGALAEPVRKEFGLDDKQIGALSTAFTLLYAVVGVPLGWLADRTSRTKLLSAGVAVWSILTAASGLAQSFRQLFIIRLGVGVGEATCAPAATALIGDLFPARVRGKVMAIFMLGLPLGIALSFLVSTTIAQWYDWRTAFYIAGLPGLLCAVLVLWIKEPARGAADLQIHQAPAQKPGSFFSVLMIPTVWWLILSGALHNLNMYALGAFLSSLLQRYHGVSIMQAGIMGMIAYGLSGVPGLLLGGWGADKLRAKRADGRLLVGAVAILIAIPLTYGALIQKAGNTVPVTLLLAIGCGFMYVYYAAVYPTLHDVVEPNSRGTAMALYFFAMYVLGASLGPYIMGIASDHFALQAALADGVTNLPVKDLPLPYRAEGLRQAMMAVPVVNVVLAAVLFAGCFTVRRDIARITQKNEPTS